MITLFTLKLTFLPLLTGALMIPLTLVFFSFLSTIKPSLVFKLLFLFPSTFLALVFLDFLSLLFSFSLFSLF